MISLFHHIISAFILISLLFVGCGKGGGWVQQKDLARNEGILVVGNGPEIESLDPAFSSGISAIQIEQAVFEGLVGSDPHDLSPIPAVAERWEVSPDGKTYRFYLREDARWSDGHAVTASDFLFGWTRMLYGAEGGGMNASLFFLIRGAKEYSESGKLSVLGVRVVTDRVLEVQLAYPAPHLLNLLAHPAFSPIPEHHLRHLKDPRSWTSAGAFVGNGPFVVKDWRPNEVLEVERNPYYWDRKQVRLNGIRFLPIDDAGAEERAFLAGQLHVTETIPAARVNAYQGDQASIFRSDPYLGVYYVLLNHRVQPLDDVRFRRALSAAVKRTLICEKLLGAGQQAALTFTPQGMESYEPPVVRFELSEQKWSRSKMSYLFNTSDDHRKIGEALGQMWTSVLGQGVFLENVEFSTYLSRRSLGDFEMARASWIADYADPTSFLDIWKSDGMASEWAGWSSIEFDQKMNEAALSTDAAERLQHLVEAETILLEAAVMIPIYHYVANYLIQPEVDGWNPTVLDWHPWKFVGFKEP